MEAPRLERKLVAILAADVEGYSRHMEQDEVATLATLSSHRLVVDGLIVSHNGRITGTAGDSVLAEFASVVDALDCAVKIQEALAVANESIALQHRLLFRIGINVGDVMVKDGDIFGDGVNIAARLESLADAGGICVSRGVRDHVHKMGQYAFSDLGEQSVKNIAQPIRAFRVRSADAKKADGNADDEDDTAPPRTLPEKLPEKASEKLVETLPERLSERLSEKLVETLAEKLPETLPETLVETLAETLRQTLAGPMPPGPAPQHSDDPAEFELAFWDAMKDSKDPAEFTAYLERYPAGAFVVLAKARLQALLEPEATAQPAAADSDLVAVELAFWDTVKESDNPAMVGAYLERYPEGAFAALAKVRLIEVGSPSSTKDHENRRVERS